MPVVTGVFSVKDFNSKKFQQKRRYQMSDKKTIGIYLEETLSQFGVIIICACGGCSRIFCEVNPPPSKLHHTFRVSGKCRTASSVTRRRYQVGASATNCYEPRSCAVRRCQPQTQTRRVGGALAVPRGSCSRRASTRCSFGEGVRA